MSLDLFTFYSNVKLISCPYAVLGISHWKNSLVSQINVLANLWNLLS